MRTEVITDRIEAAAELLQRGGLAAVPTETVYGLAGNGLRPEIIEKIYTIKGRPAVKPISLMVSGEEAIRELCCDVPEQAIQLAHRFWPGPLTLVLRARAGIPSVLRAGGETVGLRCPKQEQTLRLLRMLDFPLAVPSANPSGAPSPKSAEEVMRYFDGKIEAVIDGGVCDLGIESTVLDMSSVPYRVLRQGAIPEEEISDALTDVLYIVGITGGSGCGKTTALEPLRERGAAVLDCDEVYHELLQHNTAMIEELGQRFPEAYRRDCQGGREAPDPVLCGDPAGSIGSIDRRTLARLVFQDAGALRDLNGITHRYITEEIRNRLRQHAMQGGRLAALDAVELIDSGLAEQCDLLLGVTASEETRLKRITERDGIGREAALARIRAQKPETYYRQHCDAVLENNGSRSEFLQKLESVLSERIQAADR
ncbi:MAG: threonylcarbamoyl-AMP synthase [Oscillospiraceae bacterium]|nr:threonylcarbamoyl-AMP synthase [Oscillospiraceae bacterium]